jgi:hypothetical protein
VDDGPLLVLESEGKRLLLVTRSGTQVPAGSAEYQPKLYLEEAGLVKEAGALPNLAGPMGALAAADFDRDGQVDVFLGARAIPGKYPLAGRSGLWRRQGEQFVDVTEEVVPGLREVGIVNSALWTDVDDDGWPDLLLALEWGGVKYFHNHHGHLEDWSERAGFATAGTGWWTGLAAADFNGDGRMDYVVGNLGLNTQYRASAENPALLYYGPFGEGNGSLLLEGYYENGRLYPWRTRNELGAKIPGVLRKYPHNDDYARASLGEIVGEAKLTQAKRFQATELRSGVFLSQPDGTYRFEPLPRIAQIAPWQGVEAGDFDGDGLADIYAVQNSYAPIPSIGRFDGGLSQLLRGDGHGHFEPVPVAQSGLVVPGDAKALVRVDLNGDQWPDFVVSRNQERSLAFLNTPKAGRHYLKVHLQGTGGNLQAIGAKVRVETGEGQSQSLEVTAGSGYSSQSSPELFFGYSEAHPLKTLQVRWPSGQTTRQPVPANATELSVQAP